MPEVMRSSLTAETTTNSCLYPSWSSRKRRSKIGEKIPEPGPHRQFGVNQGILPTRSLRRSHIQRNKWDLNNHLHLPPPLTDGKFHAERGPVNCPRSLVAYGNLNNNTLQFRWCFYLYQFTKRLLAGWERILKIPIFSLRLNDLSRKDSNPDSHTPQSTALSLHSNFTHAQFQAKSFQHSIYFTLQILFVSSCLQQHFTFSLPW